MKILETETSPVITYVKRSSSQFPKQYAIIRLLNVYFELSISKAGQLISVSQFEEQLNMALFS